MIRRVRFLNYMTLRDVEIEFDDPLTVFAGPNGSGKSSVLRGISRLCRIAGGEPVSGVFPDASAYNEVYSRGAQGSLLLSFEVDQPNFWIMTFRATPRATPTFEDPTLVDWNARVEVEPSPEAGGIPPGLQEYRSAIWLKLNPARLAAPSYSDDPVPQIGADGNGLATALAHLALSRPDEFRGLVDSLREIVPGVRGLRFERTPLLRVDRIPVSVAGQDMSRDVERRVTGESLLFDLAGGSGVPAHLVSEGTLIALGVLAVLSLPARPRTLLLDDLDQALHPKAQMSMVQVLRQLLNRSPGLQIVGTSHSLYVLDQLTEDQVRVLTTGEHGSICGRLSDHRDFKSWKSTMSPGEFWSHVGEDWLLKREPVTAQP
jgi:predicted ATPase